MGYARVFHAAGLDRATGDICRIVLAGRMEVMVIRFSRVGVRVVAGVQSAASTAFEAAFHLILRAGCHAVDHVFSDAVDEARD